MKTLKAINGNVFEVVDGVLSNNIVFTLPLDLGSITYTIHNKQLGLLIVAEQFKIVVMFTY